MNLEDLGLSYEEIKLVMEEYLDGKLSDYYNIATRIRKNGKIIYDEYPSGNFVKHTFSNNNRLVYSDRWVKTEYDKNFNLIYRESSDEGVTIDRG